MILRKLFKKSSEFFLVRLASMTFLPQSYKDTPIPAFKPVVYQRILLPLDCRGV